ncbi:MAG: flagellar export chaperone FliS [Planctomycetota bacterium]|nr:flagellar export chaperone FliS [Planctomycetota bacterium]
MDPRAAADVYRNSSIENAPPIQIVRLLYEGSLRFLDAALREDAEDPHSKFCHFVGRADAIVTELRLAIDHSVDAPEVTENLERLYLFCEAELGQSGYERDASRLPGVQQVLRILLDAWRHIELEEAA